jgi:hypothetical protein
MSICPHCKSPSVPPIKVFFSYPDQPAKCQHCAGLSYLPSSATFLLNLILFPGVGVPLVATANLQSFWPVALFAALCAVEFARILVTAKLVPIQAQEARVRRRHGNIFLAALGMSAIGYMVITEWWR